MLARCIPLKPGWDGVTKAAALATVLTCLFTFYTYYEDRGYIIGPRTEATATHLASLDAAEPPAEEPQEAPPPQAPPPERECEPSLTHDCKSARCPEEPYYCAM